MNTGKVYFCKVYKVADVNNYLMRIDFEYVKNALVVVKKNVFGNSYMKDLNTNEKYCVKAKTKLGTLYVSKTSVNSFERVTGHKDKNLRKEKIKTIGNAYLEKFRRS